MYLYDLYGSQNKERIFRYIINFFMFITETERVYCSVRTKYWTVIQVCIPVGRVNVVWWVGLGGFCKGMNTPLDSANQHFTWLHGAESFLGSEYKNKFPSLFRYKFHDSSQHPSTVAWPKADDLIQYTSCSSHIRSNIIVHLHVFLPNVVFPSFFPPQVCVH